jgi:uncharacterized protein
MRDRTNFYLMLALMMIGLETYCYFALKSLIQSQKLVKVFTVLYASQVIFLMYAFFVVWQSTNQGELLRSAKVNLFLGLLITSFVTKLVFSGLMIFQDSGRLLVGGINLVKAKMGFLTSDEIIPSRRSFLTTSASFIAGIPLVTMLYGITKGKYQYTVSRKKIAFDHLPSSFDGLKVVQISDIHAGSFDSIADVERGIDMINSLEPDIFVFTGDLVNSQKDEINPYISVFSKVKAKYGKYAVLGNHDYYGEPKGASPSEVQVYWDDFFAKYQAMGFDLLRNENKLIQASDGQKIALLGVENWGAGPWFQKYGDLDLALRNVPDDTLTILLSHDPTHWDEKVLNHDRKIDLTLSGHTHGMQFGVDLPGFKWSPAKYRYERWAGLYTQDGRYLYVNKGFGFLAFPGRVGMWPEITLLELSSVDVS